MVAVDSDLRPLHEAIIWMDRRAVEQTKLIESGGWSGAAFRDNRAQL